MGRGLNQLGGNEEKTHSGRLPSFALEIYGGDLNRIQGPG